MTRTYAGSDVEDAVPPHPAWWPATSATPNNASGTATRPEGDATCRPTALDVARSGLLGRPRPDRQEAGRLRRLVVWGLRHQIDRPAVAGRVAPSGPQGALRPGATHGGSSGNRHQPSMVFSLSATRRRRAAPHLSRWRWSAYVGPVYGLVGVTAADFRSHVSSRRDGLGSRRPRERQRTGLAARTTRHSQQQALASSVARTVLAPDSAPRAVSDTASPTSASSGNVR